MDNITVKIAKVEDYVKDLEEVFVVLRKYGMKLNLEKYMFKVALGRFLGLWYHRRG